MVFREPRFEELLERIRRAPVVAAGTPTLAEAGIVLHARLVDELNLSEIPPGEPHWREVVDVYCRYGKGRQPTGLNFSDCLSYAAARLTGVALLYTGRSMGGRIWRGHRGAVYTPEGETRSSGPRSLVVHRSVLRTNALDPQPVGTCIFPHGGAPSGAAASVIVFGALRRCSRLQRLGQLPGSDRRWRNLDGGPGRGSATLTAHSNMFRMRLIAYAAMATGKAARYHARPVHYLRRGSDPTLAYIDALTRRRLITSNSHAIEIQLLRVCEESGALIAAAAAHGTRSLSDRPHRGAVAEDSGGFASCEGWSNRSPEEVSAARDLERHLLPSQSGVFVAHAAARFSALERGLVPLSPLEAKWHLGARPCCAAR